MGYLFFFFLLVVGYAAFSSNKSLIRHQQRRLVQGAASRFEFAAIPPEKCNEYELAVKGSQAIEGILQEQYGAQGKGLHEKLTSLGDAFDTDVMKTIRWIASARNGLVHEGVPLKNRAEYHAAILRVIAVIDRAPQQPQLRSRWVDIHILSPVPLQRDPVFELPGALLVGVFGMFLTMIAVRLGTQGLALIGLIADEPLHGGWIFVEYAVTVWLLLRISKRPRRS